MAIRTLKEIFFVEENEMSEVAISPEDAETGKLAIFLIKQPGAMMAVIYSPEEFDEYILKPFDDRFIKGMIRAYDSKYFNAYEIKIVAALRGYGPMLYQLLSSRVGWIVSDRRQVSEMAENIWKWMYEHPKDWMKEKLMEIKEAKTPLDFRYKWLRNNPSFNKMIALNETNRKLVSQKHNMSIKDFDSLLIATADKFFDKRFF